MKRLLILPLFLLFAGGVWGQSKEVPGLDKALESKQTWDLPSYRSNNDIRFDLLMKLSSAQWGFMHDEAKIWLARGMIIGANIALSAYQKRDWNDPLLRGLLNIASSSGEGIILMTYAGYYELSLRDLPLWTAMIYATNHYKLLYGKPASTTFPIVPLYLLGFDYNTARLQIGLLPWPNPPGMLQQ